MSDLSMPNSAPSVAEGLPWRVTPWGDGSTPTGHANIVSDVWEVVIASGLVEETAAFIVKAVNCHDDLLEALKAMTEEWVDYMAINNLGDPWAKHNMKRARAAISKASPTTKGK